MSSTGSCAYCGIPMLAIPATTRGETFCCYGCRLISGIVGHGGDRVEAWSLLRFGIGALLAMNVMMISLLLYTGKVEPQWMPTFRWLLLALATPAMAAVAYPIAAGGLKELSLGRASLDTLISIGTFVAFGVSAVNTFRGAGHLFFDTATMLPVLVTLGKLLESGAKARLGRLARHLETLLPERARRITPQGVEEVPPADLRPGDLIRVLPGERVPADGRVEEGESELSEAFFSGEAELKVKGPGSDIYGGMVNGAGLLHVKVTRTGEEILVAGILAMADAARQSAPAVERMAERVSAYFIPAVLAVAAAAGILWGLYDPARGGMAALSVVVVACPCALGIATPLATSLALAKAVKAGVLVRGGDVLERMADLSVVFFDKTGTVTTTEPKMKEVVSFDPLVNAEELLGWLATLETASEHAVAKAVVCEAAERGITLGTITYASAFPGQGIRGMVNWRGMSREVLAGTAGFVQPETRLQALPTESATVINVAWGGRIRGRVLLSDVIRSDAREAVHELGKQGIETILLSGDNFAVARSVATDIGIEQVEAPRRPQEKIAMIRTAIHRGERVAMVGDGINDVPALAAAHVGIAVAAGTDVARQAGSVVLLNDRLSRIPWLIGLSRATRSIIKQNLGWAFGYNGVMIAVAAAGFLHPLLAAVAMVVSSMTVMGNSLRLNGYGLGAGLKAKGP